MPSAMDWEVEADNGHHDLMQTVRSSSSQMPCIHVVSFQTGLPLEDEQEDGVEPPPPQDQRSGSISASQNLHIPRAMQETNPSDNNSIHNNSIHNNSKMGQSCRQSDAANNDCKIEREEKIKDVNEECKFGSSSSQSSSHPVIVLYHPHPCHNSSLWELSQPSYDLSQLPELRVRIRRHVTIVIARGEWSLRDCLQWCQDCMLMERSCQNIQNWHHQDLRASAACSADGAVTRSPESASLLHIGGFSL
ncbi:hypothetical protein ACA910_010508 [Epithemia clementina (nom. ined.)]